MAMVKRSPAEVLEVCNNIEDLENCTLFELLDFYNEYTNENLKLFVSEDIAIEMCWPVLQELIGEEEKETETETETEDDDDLDDFLNSDDDDEEDLPKEKGSFGNVGEYIKKLLLDKKPRKAKEIVKRVKSLFPKSKINTKDISWYKHKLKKEGKLI